MVTIYTVSHSEGALGGHMRKWLIPVLINVSFGDILGVKL